MPPPTNYVGPADVFGVSAAEDPEGVERPGLPVVREIDDHEAWLKTGHRKDAVVGRLPKSLREALRAFILVIAALAVVYKLTRELDYRYNAPELVPGGIPVDLSAAANAQHSAAMGSEEPAAPALVQIGPAPAATTDVPESIEPRSPADSF